MTTNRRFAEYFDECKCDEDCPVAMNFARYHGDGRYLSEGHNGRNGGHHGFDGHANGPFQEQRAVSQSMMQEQMQAMVQWFTEWDELHRLQFIDFLLDRCQPTLIRYMKYESTRRLKHAPKTHDIQSKSDFTRVLPRSISIRVFSYLDHKTLGRCAMVCGYWKYLSESNEIWEKKINRLPRSLIQHYRPQVNGNSNNVGVWKNAFKKYSMSHTGQRRRSNGALVPSYSKNRNEISNQQHRPTKIPQPQPQSQLQQHHHHHQATVIEERLEQTIILNRQFMNNLHGSMGTILQKLDDEEIDEFGRGSPPYQHGHAHRRQGNQNGARGRAQSAHGGARRKPILAPWRPSAQRPEDTHFDKFGKNPRLAQNIRRVPTPSGPRIRPASSTHNIRLSNEDHSQNLSGIQRSSSNKLLPAPSKSRPENNAYLNHGQHSADHLHENISVTNKAMHTRKNSHNGNRNGNGKHGPNGEGGNGRERNIQLHVDGDDEGHWKYTKGGVAGFISGDDGSDDGSRED